MRHVKTRVPAGVWSRLRGLRPGAAARPSLTELAQRFGTEASGLLHFTPHDEHHWGPWRDRDLTTLERRAVYSRALQAE